ncbi:Rpn family recombination-promoting nuclease/putative transposase [Sporosarcina sp. P33]|uniref:Rpn family recombination-promoting nuclease/putative transposase n=1 Tax=Sporosarcina sp. P33 TaxID=1930764 RepID=UPI0009BE2499|nr:Rpn family recombination-promoting nuclease/putative transposase [Sporosarcina sp. P33]ARD48847.1 hypothetical protein SporoP33_11835 [Sporosarcina sp. P33]
MNRKALRRIPLTDFMDLTVDYAFKQMFGSEKNKQITIVFLNAILQRTGRDTIKEVIFAKQETGGKYKDDKQSRLDIVVRTQSNELINIEVQVANDHSMFKRTLFYWANLYTTELETGQGYHKLVPTITINICNFTVYDKNEYYHNTFHLYEDSSLRRLDREDDVLEIHFIELNKFLKMWERDELNALDDILVRWLLLLSMVDARKNRVYDQIYQELEELAMRDDSLMNAFTAWEELSQSKKDVVAYQSRLKYILDEEGKLDDVKYKAIKERDEEIIRNSVKSNIPIETISAITGHSVEKLHQIIKQLGLE